MQIEANSQSANTASCFNNPIIGSEESPNPDHPEDQLLTKPPSQRVDLLDPANTLDH